MRKRINRLVVWTVAVCLVLAIFPASAFAAASGNFTYQINGNEVTITGFTGKGGNVTVPNTIGGKPVTALAENAFGKVDDITGITYNGTEITGLTFGSNMKNIPSGSLNACAGLQNITVDAANKAYTSIDGVLFDKAKTKLLKYPSTKGTESYTVPDGVTEIGSYAFYITLLREINLPESLKKIGDGAFFACIRLNELSIPAGLETIGNNAFFACMQMTGFIVDSANTHYSSDMFGALFNYDKTTLIRYNSGYNRSAYRIPDTVTKIADGAFSYSILLQSISIPAKVASIGEKAFVICGATISVDSANPNFICSGGVLLNKAKTELVAYPPVKQSSDYNVPGSVKTIRAGGFVYAGNLISISMPDSVNKIGDEAFFDCMSLKSVSLSKNIKTIGDRAFASCTELKSISIPNSVKNLGQSCFISCASLSKVVIGSGVSKIDDYTFYYCSALKSITLPKNIKSIGQQAFSFCKKLTDITIPYTVLSVSPDAFTAHSSKLTIQGYSGSYAQSFAKKYNIKFKSIGNTPLYAISAKANNPAFGTVSGNGKINYGKSCTVKAKAKAGYAFQAWKEGAKVVSASASYTFTATKNRTLTAVFVKK